MSDGRESIPDDDRDVQGNCNAMGTAPIIRHVASQFDIEVTATELQPPPRQAMLRTRLVLRLFLFGLGAVLLAYIARHAAYDLSHFAWGQISIAHLATAAILSFAAQVGMHLRWWCLLPRGVARPPAADVCGIGFTGSICDYIIVGGLGGMAIRTAWLIRRQGIGTAAAAVNVLLDRVLGFATLSVIGLTAFICFSWEPAVKTEPAMRIGLISALLGVTGAMVIVYWAYIITVRRWPPSIISLLHTVGGRRFGAAIVLSFVSQLLAATSLASVATAISGGNLGFLHHSLVFSISEVVSAIVPIPGGLGIREAAISSGYQILKTDADSPEAVALVSRAAMFAATLAGATIFGLRDYGGSRSRRPPVGQ